MLFQNKFKLLQSKMLAAFKNIKFNDIFKKYYMY